MAERDIELAHLRLAAFAAMKDMQFPTGNTIKIGDKEFPERRPMTLFEQQDWADRLVEWALSAPPETPTDTASDKPEDAERGLRRDG